MTTRWLTRLVIAATVASMPLGVGAQSSTGLVEQRQPALVVAGDVTAPLALSIGDLKVLPRKAVTVEEEGRSVRYEGVLVAALLERAGAPSGADLRGPAVAAYVVAVARDGYRAVYSVAELDPLFTGSEIIVADTADGRPLFDYQGPLRIVAPRDTRGARSVRMLERIELVRLPGQEAAK
ncbi:MAG: molybdopterin-dependent oxidoreductase [Vicinamibacterales bacterium]